MRPRLAQLLALAGALLLTALPLGATEPATVSEVEQARAAMDAGRHREAEALLRKLLRQTDLAPDERVAGYVLWARLLRWQKNATEAIRFLRSCELTVQGTTPFRMELAQCHLAAGEGDKAYALFLLCREDRDREVRCLARYYAAQFDYRRRRYDPCIFSLEMLVADGRLFSQADLQLRTELREVLAAAPELLAAARLARLRERYGQDYVYYRVGRQAEADGQFSEAIRQYERIRSPVLAAAAGCYIPKCMARSEGKNAGARALSAYTAFIAPGPTGLYREEAALERALLRCRLLPESDEMEKTSQQLDELLRLLPALSATADPAALKDVEPVLRDFPVSREFARTDDAGNLIRSYVGPETVCNRLTTPWYLDAIALKALLLKAYVATMLGLPGEADAALTQLEERDRRCVGRLMARSGGLQNLRSAVARRTFLVSSETWDDLKGRTAPVLRLALFFYVAGENDMAGRLFDDVADELRASRKGISDIEAGTVWLGLGCCAFRKGASDDAVENLERAVRASSGTSLHPLSEYLLANQLAGRADGYARAAGLYEHIALKHRHSAWGCHAELGLALSALQAGKLEVARSAAEDLARVFGKDPLAACVPTLLGLIDQQTATGAKREGGIPRHARVGRVIEVKRVLPFPGGGSLACPNQDLAAADLLSYEVTFQPRNPCVIIRQVGMRLNEMEPQVPPRPGRTVSFLRVPLLDPGLSNLVKPES